MRRKDHRTSDEHAMNCSQWRQHKHSEAHAHPSSRCPLFSVLELMKMLHSFHCMQNIGQTQESMASCLWCVQWLLICKVCGSTISMHFCDWIFVPPKRQHPHSIRFLNHSGLDQSEACVWFFPFRQRPFPGECEPEQQGPSDHPGVRQE